MIRIEGLSLEKFLNLTSNEGLRVFQAYRRSYTVLRVGLSARAYRRLKRVIPDRYRVMVERTAGIPFLWTWLVRRPAMLVGLLVISAVVYIASLFVWDVRVEGLEGREAKAMLQELEEMGISRLAYKQSLDLDEIETELLIDHDEIAWLDLKMRGVVAVVDIVLAQPVPEIVDDNTPCHVVADMDAYIETITPLCGEPQVRAGSTVRKGDILISGLIWDEGTRRMLVAARGEVIGNVWYTATASMPLFEQERMPTGSVQTTREITIGKDSVLLGEPCSFAEYDTKTIDQYYIGDRLFLPVSISVYEHSEVQVKDTPADLNYLKVLLEERAYNHAQAQMPKDAAIVAHQAFFEVDEQTLTVTVYFQTHQDIGEIVYIDE